MIHKINENTHHNPDIVYIIYNIIINNIKIII